MINFLLWSINPWASCLALWGQHNHTRGAGDRVIDADHSGAGRGGGSGTAGGSGSTSAGVTGKIRFLLRLLFKTQPSPPPPPLPQVHMIQHLHEKESTNNARKHFSRDTFHFSWDTYGVPYLLCHCTPTRWSLLIWHLVVLCKCALCQRNKVQSQHYDTYAQRFFSHLNVVDFIWIQRVDVAWGLCCPLHTVCSLVLVLGWGGVLVSVT